jgi:hypothetical protein
VLCLQNVTAHDVKITNPLNKMARNLLTNRSVDSKIQFKPYQTIWLESFA